MGFWTNIVQRWNKIFQAKANAVTTNVENENVLELYKLGVNELTVNINKITVAVANTRAELELQKKKCRDKDKQHKDYEISAKRSYTEYMALQDGDPKKTELYKLSQEILQRKNILANEVQSLTYTCADMEKQIIIDEANVKGMRLKLEDIKSKQSILESKHHMTKAKRLLAETVGGLSNNNSTNLARLEEEINRQELQTNSLADMTTQDMTLQTKIDNMQIDQEVNYDMIKMEEEIKAENEARLLKAREASVKKALSAVDTTSLKIPLNSNQQVILPTVESEKDSKMKMIDGFFNQK